MSAFGTMNGKYFRTAMDDIKGSEGAFKNFLLLGLLQFVPIFGQMCTYGYAYEWAHKIAWGVKTPMSKNIFGGPGSKMLRWGWFVLVIVFVFNLVPMIVSGIGSAITGAGTAMTYDYGFDYQYRPAGPAIGAMLGGSVVSLIAAVLMVVVVFFYWVGSMRMVVYDRLSAGLQLSQIWKMMKADFGGLLRIFGMSLLFGLIMVVVVSVIVGIVMLVAVAAGIGFAADYYNYGSQGSMTAIAGIIMAMLPLYLIILYAANVYNAFLETLTARALGYWTMQFDVANWGRMNDPLPFEHAPAGAQWNPSVAMPESPMAQQQQVNQQIYSQQPQQNPAQSPAQSFVGYAPIGSQQTNEVPTVVETPMNTAELEAQKAAEAAAAVPQPTPEVTPQVEMPPAEIPATVEPQPEPQVAQAEPVAEQPAPQAVQAEAPVEQLEQAEPVAGQPEPQVASEPATKSQIAALKDAIAKSEGASE